MDFDIDTDDYIYVANKYQGDLNSFVNKNANFYKFNPQGTSVVWAKRTNYVDPDEFYGGLVAVYGD